MGHFAIISIALMFADLNFHLVWCQVSAGHETTRDHVVLVLGFNFDREVATDVVGSQHKLRHSKGGRTTKILKNLSGCAVCPELDANHAGWKDELAIFFLEALANVTNGIAAELFRREVLQSVP